MGTEPLRLHGDTASVIERTRCTFTWIRMVNPTDFTSASHRSYFAGGHADVHCTSGSTMNDWLLLVQEYLRISIWASLL